MDLLLDTNAVLYYPRGDPRAARMVKEADSIGVSFITVIELLSYEGPPGETASIKNLLALIRVYYPDAGTTPAVIALRKQTRLKIPDAIIAAQALQNGLTLATFDKEMIQKCLSSVPLHPIA